MYLLDPPVRWLTRARVPRVLAILIVYVVAIVAIVEFLNLTLRPLINEATQFIEDFPPSWSSSTNSSGASPSSTRDSTFRPPCANTSTRRSRR